MAYAALSDLVTRFGAEELEQLTDRSGRQDVDAATVAARIADADAMIDGYLAQRYALPVSPVPVLLKGIACDIVRYMLHGSAATEAVRTAYTDALKLLRDLSSGAAVLPGAAAALPGANPAAGGGIVSVAAPARIFDRVSIGDYLG